MTRGCRPLVAVSQHLTRNHGQGKINLELLLRLARRGWPIDAVCSWLEPCATTDPMVRWRRVFVPKRAPTNWLRCELFRHQAQRATRGGAPVALNNGAAAVVPSLLNVAMFVHSAWVRDANGPRWSASPRAALQAAFSAHQSRLEKRAFRVAEHVVALSDRVRSELVEHCGIDQDRVTVIPPGVDADAFRPIDECEENELRRACRLPAKDDRPLALFVGEIRSARKNLDLVLESLVGQPDWLLAVLGSATGSPYPAMAQRLGIADRVIFLGHQDDVPTLMRGGDLFVFPTHYEPFGLVVTEAMSSGLPVVVTAQAGAACVVQHGRDGWVLADGSDRAGLDAAFTEASDPEHRRTIGRQARGSAELHTWDDMTDAYERLLTRFGCDAAG
ncbi:MAG: glycosyltransferase family 4 protein [Lacipirellulaceae bacterium]